MSRLRHIETLASRVRDAAQAVGRPVRLMEVCGTHTHAIGRGGLRARMPAGVQMISGPGCPVCVTAQRDIERMLSLARIPGVTLCTFGDMLRVPGTHASLERERTAGADVRVVYSPLDALRIAESEPWRQTVFLAVGFETTAPTVAAVIEQANARGVTNLSIYAAHKLILPAMDAVLQGGSRIDGFLTPGHVTVILGPEAYVDLCHTYRIPCVATGFEPEDVLEGVAMLLEAIAAGQADSTVQYRRAVKPGGNAAARAAMERVFTLSDAEWRGLGVLPGSGLTLRPCYAQFDAVTRFALPYPIDLPPEGCRCGDVLKGMIEPTECGYFGKRCTPRNPLGPCMVSSEGSCAARYKYG